MQSMFDLILGEVLFVSTLNAQHPVHSIQILGEVFSVSIPNAQHPVHSVQILGEVLSVSTLST